MPITADMSIGCDRTTSQVLTGAASTSVVKHWHSSLGFLGRSKVSGGGRTLSGSVGGREEASLGGGSRSRWSRLPSVPVCEEGVTVRCSSEVRPLFDRQPGGPEFLLPLCVKVIDSAPMCER